MFRGERRAKILDLLDQYGRVEVDDLASRFGVGMDSIRKDLQALAKEGKCNRVYGGATRIGEKDESPSPQPARSATQSAVPQMPSVPLSAEDAGRLAVAKRAYLEIHDGDSIFLDISRTNTFLADLIARGDKQVIVTTNMIEVLQKLSNLKHVTALGTGGYLNVQLNGFVGDTTISMLEPLLFSKAFI